MQKRIKVNGTTWTLKLVTADELAELREGGPFAALCSADEKVIYFDKDELSLTVVKHEIYHSYCSDLYLSDTHEITLSDAEEIHASHFAEKGEKINRQAKLVYKQLKKLLEGN